jgi:hypothetical protein
VCVVCMFIFTYTYESLNLIQLAVLTNHLRRSLLGNLFRHIKKPKILSNVLSMSMLITITAVRKTLITCNTNLHYIFNVLSTRIATAVTAHLTYSAITNTTLITI